MPESLFLHIQARGHGPARVMELTGGTVRVGRGAQCEVRLGDSTLAEVECLLGRGEEAWHVQPLNPSGHLTIDGRRVGHLRHLALGVPLKVGEHWLTLRGEKTAAHGLGSYEAPIPVEVGAGAGGYGQSAPFERLENPRFQELSREPPLLESPIVEDDDDDSRRTPKSDLRERWFKTRQAEKLWEARWRAAGASLKARDPNRANHPPRPKYTSETPRPRLSPVDRPAPLIPRSAPENAPARTARAISSPELRIAATPEPDQDRELHTSASETALEEFSNSFSVTLAAVSTAEEIISAKTEVTAFIEPEPPAVPVPSTSSPSRIDNLITAAPTPEKTSKQKRRPSRYEQPKPAPPVEVPAADIDDWNWPSARVILAAHQSRAERVAARGTVSTKRSVVASITPTDAKEPNLWKFPAWLGLIPCLLSLPCVAIGVFLSWTWGQDDLEAGSIANRLLRARSASDELKAEPDTGSGTSWWRTTAEHLALRAASVSVGAHLPSQEEEARDLWNAAHAAAPLEPAVRYARAKASEPERDPSAAVLSLGMSRDVVSVAWTARQLSRAGKTEAALIAYREALQLAVKADIGRSGNPSFRDEGRRYALPHEDSIARLLREIVGNSDWNFERWAAAMPDHGVVWLAAHSVLHERESPDSAKAIDRLISLPSPLELSSSASHRAAVAEGLAIKGRFDEAAALYREAIASVSEEPIRRSWSFNLAEILGQKGDDAATIDALNAARAGRGDDDIGRRAGSALASRGLKEKGIARDEKSRTKLKSVLKD